MPRRRQPVLLRVLPSARTLVVAAALVAVAAALYGIARGTSMFAVRTIVVEGASPRLATDVRTALRSFTGTSLLSLNGAAIEQRVEDLAAVRSASYDRSFPHTLRVRVVPEVPVAVVRRGPSSWLVSARGRVIAVVDPARLRSLPRIWLPPSANVEVGSVLAEDDGGGAARALAAFAAAGLARVALWAHVRDGQLTARLRTGLELRFGPPADVALKLAIVRGMLRALPPPAAGGPTYLDVSVPERPVAGTNPQPGG